jgi:hypothetical protein
MELIGSRELVHVIYTVCLFEQAHKVSIPIFTLNVQTEPPSKN